MFLPQCAIFYFQIDEKLTQSLRVKMLASDLTLFHMKIELSVYLRVWVPHSVRRDTNIVQDVYKCITMWDANR